MLRRDSTLVEPLTSDRGANARQRRPPIFLPNFDDDDVVLRQLICLHYYLQLESLGLLICSAGRSLASYNT